LLALLVPVTSARAQIVLDGSFESPALAPNSFIYHPTGTPWTFLHNSGVINNSTAWQSGGVPAPDGAQVGFLQFYRNYGDGMAGQISQSIVLPTSGPYQLSYFLAGRLGPSGEGGDLPFDVYIDNTLIGSDQSMTNTPFSLRAMSFTASAGAHTLLIQCREPVPDPNIFMDNSAFFDAITISGAAVPEPSTLIVGGAGVIMAGCSIWKIARRRRHRRSKPVPSPEKEPTTLRTAVR
jgi:hypothetical protein